jgi:AcrR family transcriptional regulator
MARTVHEEKHAVKRNEILDVAQRFVYTKGYEQMSIQDILNELQISKGAFYHYFDSKGALLEALIERMVQDAEPVILPIVHDSQLSALEKMHGLFDASARWKTARKDYLMSLMRVWYADENALIRHKTYTRTIKYISTWLAAIIRQGIAEEVMATPYPDQMGEMVLVLLENMGDAFMDLLLADSNDANSLQRAIELVTAYNDALERMLGLASGSLNLVDVAILKEWFVPSPVVVIGNGHE